MVGKKVEGNEEQRRAAARQARREGTTPSALKETTGASKQTGHLSRHEPHEKKLAAIHQGKQEWQASSEADAEIRDPAAGEPGREFTGRESSDYTTAHERVFAALADAQREHGGEGVYLDEVARVSGLGRDQTRLLLHDLTTVHRLVTELHGTDQPDLGPRYEAKSRR
jgi:hypothetical protein